MYIYSADDDRLMMEQQAAQEKYSNGYEQGKRDAQPKWISVKERLPKFNQRVLAVCKYGANIRILYFKHSISDDVAYGTLTFRDYACDFTHWMPLPKPPKEEV